MHSYVGWAERFCEAQQPIDVGLRKSAQPRLHIYLLNILYLLSHLLNQHFHFNRSMCQH